MGGFFVTIDQLIYFLAVEKHRSFSLAAEDLYLSQSSLSKQIKKLETELNCTLFERCTRSVQLTPAGVAFKTHAQQLVDNYHQMKHDLSAFSMPHQKLSIGYIPVITQYNIANSIGQFKQSVPDLQLEFQEGEHNEIIDLLLTHQITFAFLRGELLDKNLFNLTPLSQDELVLIVAKNHPLAKKKYVSLMEVQDESFISLSVNSGVYHLFLSACERNNFTPHISCLNSRIENIIGLVSAGMGISPLMKRSIECFNRQNIEIILLKETIYSQLCLAHLANKPLTKFEQQFKNYIIQNSR